MTCPRCRQDVMRAVTPSGQPLVITTRTGSLHCQPWRPPLLGHMKPRRPR